MKLVNHHHRDFSHRAGAIKKRLCSLGCDKDLLWPHQHWPQMKFDRTPQLGAVGGHGHIRYRISIYQPHQHVRFQFEGLSGIRGYHEFIVTELSHNSCRLSHDVRAELSLIGIRNWYFLIAPLHDALIEDLLDQLESELSGIHVQQKWGLRVRLMRRLFLAKKRSDRTDQSAA